MAAYIPKDIPLQAPPIVSRFVDADLEEIQRLLEAAEAAQTTGSYEDSVGLLECAHEGLLHLGKLGDLQVAHHDMPQPENDMGGPIDFTPQDIMLQTISMMLTAYHFDPRWAQHTGLTADILSGDSYEKGDGVLPEGFSAAMGSSASGPELSTQVSLSPNAYSHHPTSRSAQEHLSRNGMAADPRETDYISPQQLFHSSGGLVRSATTSDGLSGIGISTALTDTALHTLQAEAGMVSSGDMPQVASEAPSSVKKARSKWTADELRMFEEGVAIHGEHKPKLVAAYMGTRNAEQVREHIKTRKRKQLNKEATSYNTDGASGTAYIPDA